MKNYKNMIFLLLASIVFFGCPKRIKKVEVPVQETIQIESDQDELNIRGDEFVSLSELKPVYFDFDRFNLSESAKNILDQNSKFLLSRPELEILVEGHCCECGTNEYNLALGQKRASIVRDYYINLGIKGNRIATISYGEEKPINKNVAPPDVPACIPNRRVETKVRQKK